MNAILQNGLRLVGCQVHSLMRKFRKQPSQLIRLNHPLTPELWDRQKGVRGWVASIRPVKSVIIRDAVGSEFQAELEPRPDVEYFLRFQFPCHQGFVCTRMIGEWLGKNSSAELTAVVTFADGDTTQEAIRVIDREADRAAKFLLYRDLLRCPESGEPLIVDGDVLQATSSGRTYPIENGMVDFLAEDFKTTFSIDHTDNISSWDYDQRIIDIITAHPDQLFLDCGAGLRKVCYPNVINYEIVKYSSTDVLGVAEKLPFADNSLDGVISVAVLEHVKDPFLSAAEMSRVLKPGGVMFCSVPFMQPLHGYPHHYYNMTAEGMKNLFPMLDIDEVYVPLSLHPIQSIRWMLFSYIKGLPEVERRTFENLKVKDIFQLPQFETFYQKEIPFIHRLSAEAMTEVAAGHCLIARKPM